MLSYVIMICSKLRQKKTSRDCLGKLMMRLPRLQKTLMTEHSYTATEDSVISALI